MIRHHFDRGAVEAAIRAEDPRWFDKAGKRTAALLKSGRFADGAPIWSAAKPAFMQLQRRKCVFCETQLDGCDYGRIAWDLEHFRPKSTVSSWPDPARHGDRDYGAPISGGSETGYYWLAYDIDNYAASCKICNTVFKLNYFPVAAERGRAPATTEQLAAERPFLCYPIGDRDDDPQTLITFQATTAVPVERSGHAALRGRIIIDFFGLNARDQLHIDRAKMIAVVGPALSALADGTGGPRHRRIARQIDEPALPHLACLRAFRRLFETDTAKARRVLEACTDYALGLIETPPVV